LEDVQQYARLATIHHALVVDQVAMLGRLFDRLLTPPTRIFASA
jgi:hypothetical protein